jgi:hypothetical protein
MYLALKNSQNMKTKFYLILILAVFWSCSGDGDDETTPPAATAADITGTVSLYDEGVTQTDNSNMTVKVAGTSKSATTNASGSFTLSGVTFGTYTLTYEKAGYGTFKKFGVEHRNGNTIISQTTSLGEVSTTQVTALEATVDGTDVVLSITTDPPGSLGNNRYIRYFLSADSDVSSANNSYYSGVILSQNNPLNLRLTASTLSDAGFSPGQTVYVKVYGDSFWSNEYDDLDLGRRIFPNINMNAADAVSFVVP